MRTTGPVSSRFSLKLTKHGSNTSKNRGKEKSPEGLGGRSCWKHAIGPGEARQKDKGRNNAAGEREGAGNAWASSFT